MGHVDRRRAEPRLQAGEFEAHLHAQGRVEVRERLVEQEDARLAHDRAADGDALALAAGELAGPAVQQMVDAKRRRRLLDARLDLRLRLARETQRVAHVGGHAHMRIERVALEHHGDAALGGLDVVHDLAVDGDRAARHIVDAADQPQQRGLAAAGGSDEDAELAFGYAEIDAVQYLRRAEGSSIPG